MLHKTRHSRKKKHAKKRKLPNPKMFFITMAASVLIVWFAYILISTEIGLQQKYKELQAIEAQKQVEETKVQMNEEKQKAMQEDQFYEKTAREKLGLVKPGERVYVDSTK